jgi:hypothetical protein
MTRSCQACARTAGGKYPFASTDDLEVCSRMLRHPTRKMWWEREPGWVRDDVKRMQARPGLFAGIANGWWSVEPGKPLSMAEASKRLPDLTFWVKQRRQELGLRDWKAAA